MFGRDWNRTFCISNILITPILRWYIPALCTWGLSSFGDSTFLSLPVGEAGALCSEGTGTGLSAALMLDQLHSEMVHPCFVRLEACPLRRFHFPIAASWGGWGIMFGGDSDWNRTFCSSNILITPILRWYIPVLCTWRLVLFWRFYFPITASWEAGVLCSEGTGTGLSVGPTF